jgi:hypothetical protein
MKKTFILLLLCLFFSSKAQKIDKATFDKLPDNLQLYPRNDKDEAQVPISGQIDESGWQYFSVQIFREDKLISYQRSNLSYTGNIGKFQFTPITIKAELAEYHFKIFVVNAKKDSTQIVFREHVVAGDAYLIGGQSNALALVTDIALPYRNKFARSYGATYPYEPMTWELTEFGNHRVGQLGGGIQRKIIEKYKIPVCIINQAVGGINLGMSLQRNAGNLGDLSNNYGITYARVQKAGFLNGGIKAFIWRQGENESSGGSYFWGGLFDQLFKYWRQDFPDIKQYYIFQVGLIAWPERYAGALRDYQRRTKTIYAPFVENIACVGTKGYDGIHYDSSGHNQTNTELFRMIDRDLYKAKFTGNINSPNIKKAYFSKEDRTRITLEFESDQKMVWVEDTLLYDKNGRGIRQYMKNMFFFGENNTLNDIVIAGRAVDNKIILTLNNPPPAKNTVNYLPAFHDDAVFTQFGGPFLKNAIGMRAFSFDEVAIDPYIASNFEPLATPELTVDVVTFQSLKLSWKTVNQAKSYILQRKANLNDTFQEIAKLGADKIIYSDSLLKDNTTYYYRLKALGDKPESDFGMAEALTPKKLILPELSANITSYQSLKISWKAISNANLYILERKANPNDAYIILAKLGADKTAYSDSLLKDNVTYFYRIKALGINTESDFASAQAITPQKLSTPELTVTTVSFQSLKISWKIIPKATAYILERKAALNDVYKEIAKFGTDKITFLDSLLKDNVTYYYRLKALGDKTESDFVMAENTTPQKLSTPELSVTVTSYQSLRISWKAISKANSYTLERKANPNDSYKELAKLGVDKTVFSDSLLKDNSTYYYRLKAFGDKTESDVAVAQANTAQILILEEDLTNIFTIYPNPSSTEIHLKFMKSSSGKVSIFNTVGSILFETELKNQLGLNINVSNFRKGVYFLKFSGLEGDFVRKIVVE